ncbi:MAG: acyl carrier protein [Lachnospiraceae bacterium]|jgi:Acyl carrier protein|nr:acyl carrier protein [Lachnospiraceae bacterium]
MTEREKLALLEDLFELEEGAITPDTKLCDIAEYDSMSKLSMIVMMEDEFGVKLDGSTIKAFQTVGDILAKMEK